METARGTHDHRNGGRSGVRGNGDPVETNRGDGRLRVAEVKDGTEP